ncbi:MAG: FecR domain-containing protein [Alphaproteobacteria bacterium]|jgi:hypothetical protein|nr:FecR domain-containing protein [Alphaproteobacteria bacterium]
MRIVAVAALLVAALWVGPSAAAEDAIGSVKTVEGSAHVERAGKREAAKVGTAVFRHDALQTGKDGSMGVTLKDETMISVGPNTELHLDSFAFEPEEKKYSFVTRISRGTLFYVSGLIAKLSPQSTKVVTPGGTVGVRGTRFVVRAGGK